MPNTLAHLGVQGILTRALIREADIKWIFLGAVIPDIPWIARKAILFLFPTIDPIELRLYSIAQASLAGCLLLAAALCLVSSKPLRIFIILAANSLLHLLVDAMQTKWGNGVHLVAPASWHTWNFGLFWPETVITYILTLLGVSYLAYLLFKRSWGKPVSLQNPGMSAVLGVVGILTVYFIFPLTVRGDIVKANAHSIAVLKSPCAGCKAAFDRVKYIKGDDIDRLETWAGDYVIANPSLDYSATVSVKATFDEEAKLHIEKLYEHRGFNRNVPTLIGLGIVVLVWGRSLYVSHTK